MTNKPEQLPVWRKSLNEAVENYQSTRAWYEENQDSPSAEQDMDAAAGEIEKLIKQYGVLIVLNFLDEIDELQERGKAGDIRDLFLRAKHLMYQSGGSPIENSLNPIDAWLYDAEHAAAQPAPVVPEEKRDEDGNTTSEFDHGWNACRAAMLQAGNSPVTPDGSEDTKRLNWLDTQNKRLNEYYGTAYGWKFDANFQRNAMMLNDSNFPVMTIHARSR